MINIRGAGAPDVKLLQDLNHKIMVNNFQFDEKINSDWEATEYGRKFFEERCTDSKWHTIIAEADGKPVGYLNGGLDNFGYRKTGAQKVAVIENVGVIPEFQNQGIGKLLVENFFAWTKKQGAFQVQVVCFAKNSQALDWYKQLGFEQSDIVMQKEVK